MTAETRLVAVDVETELGVITRPGGSNPFLLVHGLASNARLWDGVADRLAAAGHPSMAVDQRGHGRSSRIEGGFDFATLTSDLARLAEEVFGEPVVAVGQSWGGNVVLEMAARYPHLVSALALIDGGFIQLSERYPRWVDAARQLAPPDLTGLSPEELEVSFRERLQGWPESGLAAQLANFDTRDGRVRPHLSRSNHMRILEELWRHRPDDIAPRIDVPALVVVAAGNGDRRRVDRFASRLPRGRVVEVEGHHDIHAEQPDLVARLLVDLVAGG